MPDGRHSSALKTLEPTFHDLVLADQDCFASEDGWEALLHLIPDRDIVSELREHWQAHPGRSSEAKWQDLEDEIAQRRGKKDNRNTFVRPSFHTHLASASI